MTNRLKIRIKAATVFYLAFGIFFLRAFPGETTGWDAAWLPWFSRITKLAVLLLLVYKILKQKYSRQEIIIIGVAGVITLLSYLLCDDQSLVFLFLFVVAARDISMKSVAKETLILTIFACGLIMILTQAGVLESVTQTVSSDSRTYFWSAGNTIYLWAFRHHNYIGRRVLFAYLSYVLLRYEKYNLWDLIPFAAAFYYCYFSIKSRTPALIILMITALVVFFKLIKRVTDEAKNIFARILVYGLMIFSPIFSAFVSLNYRTDSTFYIILDDLLTTRVSFANSIYNDYGFSLFGQDVFLTAQLTPDERVGVTSVILDNAYMHMFIRYGIMLGLLIIIGYLIAAKIALDNRDYCMVLIIASLFVCGISETWLYQISSNPFALYMAAALYKKRGYAAVLNRPQTRTERGHTRLRLSLTRM